MPLSDLLAVYADCFGRKLVPAVYAAKKFQQLMGGKHTVKVLKVGMILYIYVLCACIAPFTPGLQLGPEFRLN